MRGLRNQTAPHMTMSTSPSPSTSAASPLTPPQPPEAIWVLVQLGHAYQTSGPPLPATMMSSWPSPLMSPAILYQGFAGWDESMVRRVKGMSADALRGGAATTQADSRQTANSRQTADRVALVFMEVSRGSPRMPG